MHIPLLIAYISASSVSVPLIWLFATKQIQDKRLRNLFYLLIVSFCSDLIGLVLFNLSLNTYFVVNLFLLIQFLICFLLLTEAESKTAYRLIPIGFLSFFFLNYFFIQGPSVFNSYSNSVACLILMFFSIRYFYVLLRDLPAENVMHIPKFWIAIAVLTYYSGNLLLFIVNNYLTLGIDGSHAVVWILHNLLNISKNALFTIAIWQNYRKRK